MQGKNEWTTLGKTLKYILRNVNSCPNPENTSTLSTGHAVGGNNSSLGKPTNLL